MRRLISSASSAYFRELRRSMGEPPDPARKPEVVEREIQELEIEVQRDARGAAK